MSRWLRSIQWNAFRAANIAVRACRRMAGLGDVAVIRRGGLCWELDLSETIDFSIYLTGSFQRATLEALVGMLREGDTVLDIGANMGAMALPAARAVGPQGKVICIEPTVFGTRKLRRNLELNNDLVGRIEIRQLELVDQAGATPHATMYARWPIGRAKGRHAGHHGVAEDCAGTATITLDEFCAADRLAKIDGVKLDVDGNECGVLRGARRTLEAFRPWIIVELQPSAFGTWEPDRFEDMIDLMRKAGYQLYDLDRRLPLPMEALRLRRLLPGDAVLNAVALYGAAP